MNTVSQTPERYAAQVYMPERKVFAIDATLKSLSIWEDMPIDRDPTIGNILDFLNNFRRTNSETWCDWFSKPQAGYTLAGVARIGEDFFIIYNYSTDLSTPIGEMIREAVKVSMRRTKNLWGENGGWDIKTDIVVVEWIEKTNEGDVQ